MATIAKDELLQRIPPEERERAEKACADFLLKESPVGCMHTSEIAFLSGVCFLHETRKQIFEDFIDNQRKKILGILGEPNGEKEKRD